MWSSHTCTFQAYVHHTVLVALHWLGLCSRCARGWGPMFQLHAQCCDGFGWCLSDIHSTCKCKFLRLHPYLTTDPNAKKSAQKCQISDNVAGHPAYFCLYQDEHDVFCWEMTAFSRSSSHCQNVGNEILTQELEKYYHEINYLKFRLIFNETLSLIFSIE